MSHPYSEIRMWRDSRDNSLTVHYLGGLLDGTTVKVEDWELLKRGVVVQVDVDELAAELLKPASELVLAGQCVEVQSERYALPSMYDRES